MDLLTLYTILAAGDGATFGTTVKPADANYVHFYYGNSSISDDVLLSCCFNPGTGVEGDLASMGVRAAMLRQGNLVYYFTFSYDKFFKPDYSIRTVLNFGVPLMSKPDQFISSFLKLHLMTYVDFFRIITDRPTAEYANTKWDMPLKNALATLDKKVALAKANPNNNFMIYLTMENDVSILFSGGMYLLLDEAYKFSGNTKYLDPKKIKASGKFMDGVSSKIVRATYPDMFL